MMKKTRCAPFSLLDFFPAWSVCRVPQPRLVCAEYSQSKAVVVAKLLGITSVPTTNPDYFVYKLAVVRTLRGESTQEVDLYEGNDTGRASFDWKLNEQYLLFLDPLSPASPIEWSIDSCGNSAPLARADSVLQEIQNHSSPQKYGTIHGMVSTDSLTTGIPGVTVKVSGKDYSSAATTDANGRFRQVVPAGIYKLSALGNGKSIKPEPFSYENPDHVVIAPGGCAQVQFSAAAPRPADH